MHINHMNGADSGSRLHYRSKEVDCIFLFTLLCMIEITLPYSSKEFLNHFNPTKSYKNQYVFLDNSIQVN